MTTFVPQCAVVLATTFLAGAAYAQTSCRVRYEASQGSLPPAQGWTLFEAGNSGPPPFVDNGSLHQGPTSVVGYQYWSRTDFSNLGLTLNIDGRVAQVGSTAALLGHPLRSLVAAARLSAQAGEPLQAGWIVMAGGATPAEWIKPGQYVSVDMEQLGSAGFHVKG